MEDKSPRHFLAVCAAVHVADDAIFVGAGVGGYSRA